MPYKMACPNCGSRKIRGRLRSQELFCGDCGQIWESPFWLKREHLVSGNKLAFSIKYDGIPKDISSDWKHESSIVSLVSESDGVEVYECNTCHRKYSDDSYGSGFYQARRHFIRTHATPQVDPYAVQVSRLRNAVRYGWSLEVLASALGTTSIGAKVALREHGLLEVWESIRKQLGPAYDSFKKFDLRRRLAVARVVDSIRLEDTLLSTDG